MFDIRMQMWIFASGIFYTYLVKNHWKLRFPNSLLHVSKIRKRKNMWIKLWKGVLWKEGEGVVFWHIKLIFWLWHQQPIWVPICCICTISYLAPCLWTDKALGLLHLQLEPGRSSSLLSLDLLNFPASLLNLPFNKKQEPHLSPYKKNRL